MAERKKRKWDILPTEDDKNQNNSLLTAAKKVQEVAGKISAKPIKQKLEFVKNIDINQLKARYKLTQQQFQHKVLLDTGAKITTKGKYYPDISLATEKDPPMYLRGMLTF